MTSKNLAEWSRTSETEWTRGDGVRVFVFRGGSEAGVSVVGWQIGFVTEAQKSRAGFYGQKDGEPALYVTAASAREFADLRCPAVNLDRARICGHSGEMTAGWPEWIIVVTDDGHGLQQRYVMEGK
jgi:hypothetical protein